MNHHLKIIYKLVPHLREARRKNMIEHFTYKTNKVHLIFENLSNPHNAVRMYITSACLYANRDEHGSRFDSLCS
jgi:hypothetical protein